jgi:DNA-binding NarL/FixJ family response regulator
LVSQRYTILPNSGLGLWYTYTVGWGIQQHTNPEIEMSIRTLVCDDHEVIRTGLASLLAGTDIEIIAEAANGKDALRLAQKDKPDVILLDIRMADGDGLATLEKLRAKVPECKVVMLSTYDNPTYIARAVALGASDYVLKGSPREDLIATIQAAAAGESPSRSGELKKIANTMKVRQVIDDDDVPLTQRETQVLRHVALGLSNKEIGKSLEISVETVKEHVQNILRKIAVSDRTQAAVWAVRKGLV